MAKICKSERGVNFDRITKTDKGKYKKGNIVKLVKYY